jgi:hypothetical protein
MTKKTRTTLPYGTLTTSFKGDVAGFIKAGGQDILAAQSVMLQQILKTQILSFASAPGSTMPLSKVSALGLDGGPGKAMGTPAKAAYTFQPAEIIYYRLEVSDSFDCSYADGSGIYRNSQNLHPTAANPAIMIQPSDLSDFVSGIQDGDPSNAANLGFASNVYNNLDTLANMLVRCQCYIVVELISSSTLSFHAGVPAIETIDDLSSYYFDLHHIDSTGTDTQGASSTTNLCKLFYFSVDDPDMMRASQDQFNLYFQHITAGGIDYTTKDPFIKNRGKKPPQIMAVGKAEKPET